MYVHEVVIDIQQQTATDIVVYIRSGAWLLDVENWSSS